MRVVDAAWFLPGTSASARAEHDAAHIPGAVFFDLDAVYKPKGLHPHMAPSAAKCGWRVRKLGLGDGEPDRGLRRQSLLGLGSGVVAVPVHGP